MSLQRKVRRKSQDTHVSPQEKPWVSAFFKMSGSAMSITRTDRQMLFCPVQQQKSGHPCLSAGKAMGVRVLQDEWLCNVNYSNR